MHDRILQTCQWSGFQGRLRPGCFVGFVFFRASFHAGGAGCGIEQKQSKETKEAPSLTECVLEAAAMFQQRRWRNPLPQGNDLYALADANGRFVDVGASRFCRLVTPRVP